MFDKVHLLISGPTYKDFSQYFGQMAMLMRSGLSFTESNDKIAGIQKNKIFASWLKKVQQNLANGNDIAAAFMKVRAFDMYIISMLRMGHGDMVSTCQQISSYMFRAYQIKRKVSQALFQPAISFGLLVILTLVMNFLVLPTLLGVIENNGGEIPLTMIFFINYIKPFIDNWYISAAAVIIAVEIINRTVNHNGILWHKLLLKLPIINSMMSLIIHERFSTIFALLLDRSTTSLDAMQILAENMNNKYAQQILIKAVKFMQSQGLSISDALRKADKDTKLFREDLLIYIKVGEESSNLRSTMSAAAKFYQNDISQDMEILSDKLSFIIFIPLVIIVSYFAFLVYGASLNTSHGLIEQLITR